MRTAVAAIVFVTLLGCGDETVPETTASAGGGPSVVGCPPGERDIDGVCRTAGIPTDVCLEGFEHDAGACEPILPAEPCRPGTIAVPGDRQCRPIMDCGEGTWGNIPVDGNTEYVDASHQGTSNGDADAPWTSISQALVNAGTDAIIAVAAGTYNEDVFISRKLRLWGRCPDMVHVWAAGIQPSAVVVGTAAAAGTEVHGMSVRGAQAGIYIQDVAPVLVDRVYVHDTHAFAGVGAQADLLPTTLELSDSLIENTFQAALNAAGGSLIVDRSLIRDPEDGEGTGIRSLPHPESLLQGTLTVTSSVIERNRIAGIAVVGIEANLEGVVVRDTDSRSDGLGGVGILVRDDAPTGSRAKARIVGSLSERNRLAGIQVADSDAEVEWCTVRDNLPQRADDLFGRGIQASTEIPNGTPSALTVRESLIVKNLELGVMLAGANGLLEGVIIQATQPSHADGQWGLGIRLQAHPAHGMRATADLYGNHILDNLEIGISVLGSDLVARSTIVSGTGPRAANDLFGRGITVQYETQLGVHASAQLDNMLVRDNHDTGLLVYGANATLERSVIENTRARIADGQFGDGVAVDGDDEPASLAIVSSLVRNNARAGVASFAGQVSLSRSAVTCNLVDLNGEHLDGTFGFVDEGGNTCGCADLRDCQVLTSNLVPPDTP